jgi:hypothetical protein
MLTASDATACAPTIEASRERAVALAIADRKGDVRTIVLRACLMSKPSWCFEQAAELQESLFATNASMPASRPPAVRRLGRVR